MKPRPPNRSRSNKLAQQRKLFSTTFPSSLKQPCNWRALESSFVPRPSHENIVLACCSLVRKALARARVTIADRHPVLVHHDRRHLLLLFGMALSIYQRSRRGFRIFDLGTAANVNLAGNDGLSPPVSVNESGIPFTSRIYACCSPGHWARVKLCCTASRFLRCLLAGL